MTNTCRICNKPPFSGSTSFGKDYLFCRNEICSKTEGKYWEYLKYEKRAMQQARGLCSFQEPWSGYCKKAGIPFCEKHSELKCICGEKAWGQCSFAASLVCGVPLCENCRCSIHNFRFDE